MRDLPGELLAYANKSILIIVVGVLYHHVGNNGSYLLNQWIPINTILLTQC